MGGASGPPRRFLFRKYAAVLFAAVVVPLLANGVIETWFGYRDQRTAVDRLLRTEAGAAASRIDGYVEGILTQLGWAVQLPWNEGADERQRIDAQRLLRQVPGIMSVTLVDGDGLERVYVSRVGVNRFGSGRDLSGEPAAGFRRRWDGRVLLRSQPFMTDARRTARSGVAGRRDRDLGLRHCEANTHGQAPLVHPLVSACGPGDRPCARQPVQLVDARSRSYHHRQPFDGRRRSPPATGSWPIARDQAATLVLLRGLARAAIGLLRMARASRASSVSSACPATASRSGTVRPG